MIQSFSSFEIWKKRTVFHCAGDIFKWIFLKEQWSLLKFVSKGSVDKIIGSSDACTMAMVNDSPVSSRPKPTHQEWYYMKGSEGDLAQPVFWHLWW